ncbi:hypothetical protein TWF696_008243 [Orbilia brochopaga]|uniref:Uncharacterized protein n=1 Tax=Orbilia brochopaga TaxID=3140254 RepID=A0AAV9UHE8_9PEZI
MNILGIWMSRWLSLVGSGRVSNGGEWVEVVLVDEVEGRWSKGRRGRAVEGGRWWRVDGAADE